MKKIALPVIIGFLVIIGGLYYVMNPVSEVQTNITKADVVAPIQKEAKDVCSVVKDLGYKQSCTSKPISFNGQTAFIVKTGDVYGLLLYDNKFQEIQTNLYYEPKQAVTEYLQKMGVSLTSNDWETVDTEIRMSKRGYLFGLTFTSPKEGVIYISPNGRITGKLN
ncbi:MAG: hypothetical protein CFH43_00949 [Proteobacteria bacterium]|nr:MAG: hypothetical protein CFH43_00949 [Pseudomonadota bacterium]